MNPIKIIFFDIDGTLIDMQKKQISEITLEMLRRLREKGILICLATGRSPVSLPKFDGVEFDAYLTFNGSLCYTNQEVVFSNPMRQEGLFMEFVSFINDADGNPIYENTMQWAILKKEWNP